MIWTPWKEINRLREQLDLHVNMAIEEGRKASSLQADKEVLQGRMATLIEKHEVIENLLHATLDRTNKLQEALLAIIAEEKPTSNATVKRICNMAREGVKQ